MQTEKIGSNIHLYEKTLEISLDQILTKKKTEFHCDSKLKSVFPKKQIHNLEID